MNIKKQDQKLYDVLKDRLQKHSFIGTGKNVLCLGARLGTEVKVFSDLGCFSVGIDLNPGKENSRVLFGDFHKTIFASGSVDVAYTNSLDHSIDPAMFVKEVKRILRIGGILVLETYELDDNIIGPYEAISWKDINNCLKFFEKDFRIVYRESVDYPWNGEHIVLEVKK